MASSFLFVTMLFVCLERGSGRLAFANAGHPAGYLIDQSGAVKGALSATGLPLGMFADRGYSCRAGLVLEPGDLAVLLTDGALETEAPDGAEFGAERLLEVVRANRHRPAPGDRRQCLPGRP